jgi:hypothetical protein
MGSDRARVTYDEAQQYRRVVMQQGRVTLEADWNEGEQILTEETRKEALDFVGPAGTPNDGYAIGFLKPGTPPPFDFTISAGTMYVGGVRVELDANTTYFTQSEWIDGPPAPTPPVGEEFIYLHLREQEVSAVEDRALQEVALGGPDTAQRLRVIQRVERLAVTASDCASALTQAEAVWAGEGLDFDPATMRLLPTALLQVSTVPPAPPPDPCQPAAPSGYLGADNQLIRVQVGNPAALAGGPVAPKLLWAFDDAYFLYRAQILPDGVTFQLGSVPVDDEHIPRANQPVEILRASVALPNGEYVAAETGVIALLASDYDPDAGTIQISGTLPPEYTNAAGNPVLFVRVWTAVADLVATPITLGATGLAVTLSNGPFRPGDYWLIGVRPSTPTTVYPPRYLSAPQPPDGPRQWVCPLAVIEWITSPGQKEGPLPTFGKLDSDCRIKFDPLTARRPGGCCTVVVTPDMVGGGPGLQPLLDTLVSAAQGTPVRVCLQPGTYALTTPLRLGAQHSFLTLSGCEDAAQITAATGSEPAFLDGLLVVSEATNVTIEGIAFSPPLTPFVQAGGLLALAQADAFAAAFQPSLATLNTRVAIRTLDVTLLAVRRCTFLFVDVLPANPSFSVGIFSGGAVSGIVIEKNVFQRQVTFNQKIEGVGSPVQLSIGYLIADSVVLAPQSQQTQLGAVQHSSLDDAALRDNVISGLTGAALMITRATTVRIENNRVSSAFFGFVIYAPDALLLFGGIAPPTEPVTFAQFSVPYQEKTLGASIGLALGFPLPAGGSPNVPVPVLGPFTPQAFFKALSPIFASPDVLLAATASYAISVDVDLVSGLKLDLNVKLTLHVTGNDVELAPATALLAQNDSGASRALLVFPRPPAADQDLVTGSTVLVSANRFVGTDGTLNLQNNSQDGLQTAIVEVLMVAQCVVTGNFIENLNTSFKPQHWSLIIAPCMSESASVTFPVAVTGNVLRGFPVLPPRTGTLPPWATFNALI